MPERDGTSCVKDMCKLNMDASTIYIHIKKCNPMYAYMQKL